MIDQETFEKRREEALTILAALISSPIASVFMTRQGLAGPEMELMMPIRLAFSLQESFEREAYARASIKEGPPERPWAGTVQP